MTRPVGIPDRYWDEAHATITGTDGALDRDIDELQRAIGANLALAECLGTPGWKTYQASLVKRFQDHLATLGRGKNLEELEIRYLQGRIFELEQIVTDAKAIQESNAQMQRRLDQLLRDRKNLTEESTVPT